MLAKKVAAECATENQGAGWAIAVGVVFGLAAIGSMIASAFYDGKKHDLLLYIGLGVFVASLLSIIVGAAVLAACAARKAKEMQNKTQFKNWLPAIGGLLGGATGAVSQRPASAYQALPARAQQAPPTYAGTSMSASMRQPVAPPPPASTAAAQMVAQRLTPEQRAAATRRASQVQRGAQVGQQFARGVGQAAGLAAQAAQSPEAQALLGALSPAQRAKAQQFATRGAAVAGQVQGAAQLAEQRAAQLQQGAESAQRFAAGA